MRMRIISVVLVLGAGAQVAAAQGSLRSDRAIKAMPASYSDPLCELKGTHYKVSAGIATSRTPSRPTSPTGESVVTAQPLGESQVLRGTVSYPTFGGMNGNQSIPPARVAKLTRLLASRSKKTKISISVSADLLAAADELAGKSRRSELFERGVRSLVRAVVRRARHERELALLNQHAESLNAAAADTLEFQSDVDA